MAKYNPLLGEDLVIRDYKKVLGRVILVNHVMGYKGNDSVDIYFDKSIPVLVAESDPNHDLFHWADDWLDPYWNVTPVGHVPELQGVTSLWVYGVSYRNSEKQGDIRLETFLEKIKRWLKCRTSR